MTLPCGEAPRPDDWFISKDGRQYPDEEFLTVDERTTLAASVLALEGETLEEHAHRVDLALGNAARERRGAALRARRHAKAACMSCPVRTRCLAMAIDTGVNHGTWGGYFEEELRELRREIARRQRTNPVAG